MTSSVALFEERMLVVAPFGRDAELLGRVLSDASLTAVNCHDIESLCTEISRGAGAALLTEEVLVTKSRKQLESTLREQPDWSNIPILVLASSGRRKSDALPKIYGLHGTSHFTLVERPTSIPFLVSALRTAIGARRHQYRLRDELAAHQRSEEALRESATRLRLAQRG